MTPWGRCRAVAGAAILAVALSGCVTTTFRTAPEFARGTADVRVLLMPPDIELSLVTAGGVTEPNAEWTARAEKNLVASVAKVLQERKAQLVDYRKPMEADDPIFADSGARKLPRFSESMSALEVVDFFRASLAALEVSDFQPSDFRPAAFGDKPGFRFEFTYLSKDGLAVQGFAAGAIAEKRLYLIVYSGAREHYFPKHRDDAEQIVSSVTFR
jgi:hypothetical protein